MDAQSHSVSLPSNVEPLTQMVPKGRVGETDLNEARVALALSKVGFTVVKYENGDYVHSGGKKNIHSKPPAPILTDDPPAFSTNGKCPDFTVTDPRLTGQPGTPTGCNFYDAVVPIHSKDLDLTVTSTSSSPFYKDVCKAITDKLSEGQAECIVLSLDRVIDPYRMVKAEQKFVKPDPSDPTGVKKIPARPALPPALISNAMQIAIDASSHLRSTDSRLKKILIVAHGSVFAP